VATDAWGRAVAVGLCLPDEPRGRRAGRSPLARDPRHGRRGARADEPQPRGPLRLRRPALGRPEYLLRAQLVQILYAIPSERRLVEQLRYNLLLRWFVGVPLDEPLFHVTSFTKNRDRLLNTEIAEAFFVAIRSQAEAHKLLSREHFSVDGTLIEAAAALKSLRAIEHDKDEEPPPGGGGRQPGRRLPRPAPLKRDAPLDHRPRGAPGAQGSWPRGQALLRRPRPDREPPWPDRRG